MYPSNGVIPELVSDINLKRARTEVNGKDAIRVVTTGTDIFTTDPQNYADGTGLTPTKTDVGSVNYKLAELVSKVTTNVTNTDSLSTTTGSVSDVAWTGTGNATIISLLKGIINKL